MFICFCLSPFLKILLAFCSNKQKNHIPGFRKSIRAWEWNAFGIAKETPFKLALLKLLIVTIQTMYNNNHSSTSNHASITGNSKSTALFIPINIIIKACICSFPDKNLTAAKQSSDDLKKKRTIRLKAWCFKQELFHTKTTSKATQESCKASPTQPKFGLNIWLNMVVPLILILFSGIKTHLISLTDPIYTALQTEREGKKEKARKRGRVLSHLSMALSPSVFAWSANHLYRSSPSWGQKISSR